MLLYIEPSVLVSEKTVAWLQNHALEWQGSRGSGPKTSVVARNL